MTGVSVGWFSPEAHFDNVDRFCNSISRVIGKTLPAFPMELRTVEGLSHVYAKIGGFVPMHIVPPGKTAADTKIFHFIFAAENRPLLLTGTHGDGEANTQAEIINHKRSELLAKGHDKETLASFGLGAIELVRGMFVHFDVAKTWMGIQSAPLPMRDIGLRQDPKVIMVQIVGYDAHEYADAVGTMHRMLILDQAYWEGRKPDATRRYSRG